MSLLLLALVIVGYSLYRYIEPQLPDLQILSEMGPQLPMNVYSKDGLLIAQYGEKRRYPVSLADVPKSITQAFLAAEDNRFFDHPGVDYQGMGRAVFNFLKTGEKRQGGSTITMQVARNFFLSSEKTFFRKIKEILLAVRIESKLPKEQILELYLNKIYFGQHAYGISAAAQVYYGKTINELDLSEIATLAGLPKAPSTFNPIVNPERATTRRDYVLKRMLKLGYINQPQYENALAQPVTAYLRNRPIEFDAPYIAEMVRNEMYRQFGEDAYLNGYNVYTTLDSRPQLRIEKALRLGLHDYDERHGYRGTKDHIDPKIMETPARLDEQLQAFGPIGETIAGIVITATDRDADVYIGGGRHVNLDYSGVRWARKYINENARGPVPRGVKYVIKPGDVIRLRRRNGHWMLSQIPEAEGSLVSMDAKDGALIALAAGYDFNLSKFNRAIQAQRQPGSGFKPILYAAAFQEGYTPSSVVLDAPISYTDPVEGGTWRPQNYSHRYYGPTRLRVALAKSRNLVSVRLLKAIGLPKAIATAEEFGFEPSELPNALPLALGAGSATPLRMAQAYSVFANGGFRVEPYFIDRIETDKGKVVFEASPQTACLECSEVGERPQNLAYRVLTPQIHYMMNSMLLDVVRAGTANKAKSLGRSDIAGKTGTTNDYRDAWFNGYVPGLVTVAWIGFDSSKSLGIGETGGEAAVPLWLRYMREALQDVPVNQFTQPGGLSASRLEPLGSYRGEEGFNSGQGQKHGKSRKSSSKDTKTRSGKKGSRVTEGSDSGSSGSRRSGGGEKSIESLF